jgi:regulator of nucleoside diphosphate kinase
MLSSNVRTVTEFDLRRLDALFERVRDQVRPPSTLSVLEREVAHAVVVSSEEVPATVVTMNSEVEVVDLETEERRCLTVVFPAMAGIESGRVSVLAPLGTALLGSREGANVFSRYVARRSAVKQQVCLGSFRPDLRLRVGAFRQSQHVAE